MSRLNKTESDIFISWVNSLLPKDLLFKTYLKTGILHTEHLDYNEMAAHLAKATYILLNTCMFSFLVYIVFHNSMKNGLMCF